MVGLGKLEFWAGSEAHAVSADGSVVVGGFPAFRWTEAGGMVGLPLLANGLGPFDAHGVSADGSIVVGDNDTQTGPSGAFVWDAAHGTRGIAFPGWTLNTVSGISADGSTLFGLGTNPAGEPFQGWVASLDALTLIPEPGTCVLVAPGLAALAARSRSGSTARRHRASEV
jgi:hypothetical protein